MFRFRLIRNFKEQTIIIKKGFTTYACYSGGWWNCSDEEIFEDFLHDID